MKICHGLHSFCDFGLMKHVLRVIESSPFLPKTSLSEFHPLVCVPYPKQDGVFMFGLSLDTDNFSKKIGKCKKKNKFSKKKI